MRSQSSTVKAGHHRVGPDERVPDRVNGAIFAEPDKRLLHFGAFIGEFAFHFLYRQTLFGDY